MERALWQKIAALAGLTLALLVPLMLIQAKIEERQSTRAGVVRELANTSVGEQTVSGPLLVLPCTEHYVVEEKDAKGGWKKEPRSRDCTRSHFPEVLSVTGAIATENRYRGICAARFFAGGFKFDGRFAVEAAAPPAPGVTLSWGAPLVLISMRDVRGIRNSPASTRCCAPRTTACSWEHFWSSACSQPSCCSRAGSTGLA